MRWTVVFALCALPACTSLSVVIPTGFDLTGEWRLVQGESDDPPDLNAIGRQEIEAARRGKDRDPMGSISFAVQDFPIIAADSMEIEQDSSSIGIRYGDGTYQDLTWGRHDRAGWQVHAGWQGGALVISSTRNRISGIERFYLSDAERKLTVSVFIKTKQEKLNLKRVFEKR